MTCFICQSEAVDKSKEMTYEIEPGISVSICVYCRDREIKLMLAEKFSKRYREDDKPKPVLVNSMIEPLVG